MSSLTIRNDGPLVAETNFWSLAIEESGRLCVSVNAGAIRVLVPRAMGRIVSDIRTARHAVLSRGPWPERRLDEAVEIMWDDGSDSPFSACLSPQSFDQLPAAPPARQEWRVSVWVERCGKPHRACEHVCHWRRVSRLPCLKPWLRANMEEK